MLWKATTVLFALLLVIVSIIALLWREQAITLALNARLHCESAQVGQVAVIMKLNENLICIRGSYAEKANMYKTQAQKSIDRGKIALQSSGP